MFKKSLFAAQIAASICFMSAAAFAADDMIVKIGHVAATSGPSSHLGKDNENGAKMAIDELNASGFQINHKKVKFELITEDDASDPKQGMAAAQKLVDTKVSGVVGHLNSGTAIPASKIYHDSGIPQIATVTSMEYNKQHYPSTFRVIAHDGRLGGALGRYATNELHVKKVAVIDDRTAYGQGVANQFIKGLNAKKTGVKIAQRQYTNDKATDFNAILTAIKATKPEVVFFGGMDAVAGPMLRQMKALGINAKFMSGDGTCTEELTTLAGDALGDGQVICAVSGGITATEQKGWDDFLVAYKKKFGTDVQLYAPYVYDAVMTMAEAMQQAKSSDPAVYLPFLRKIHHKGVTGEIAFNANGNIKNGSLTLYTYKGGQRTAMEVVN